MSEPSKWEVERVVDERVNKVRFRFPGANLASQSSPRSLSNGTMLLDPRTHRAALSYHSLGCNARAARVAHKGGRVPGEVEGLLEEPQHMAAPQHSGAPGPVPLLPEWCGAPLGPSGRRNMQHDPSGRRNMQRDPSGCALDAGLPGRMVRNEARAHPMPVFCSPSSGRGERRQAVGDRGHRWRGCPGREADVRGKVEGLAFFREHDAAFGHCQRPQGVPSLPGRSVSFADRRPCAFASRQARADTLEGATGVAAKAKLKAQKGRSAHQAAANLPGSQTRRRPKAGTSKKSTGPGAVTRNKTATPPKWEVERIVGRKVCNPRGEWK